MICPNQSNRGPLKKEKLKCGSLPTANIVGAVGKNKQAQYQAGIAELVLDGPVREGLRKIVDFFLVWDISLMAPLV